MPLVLIVLLAALWGAVFVPAVLRDRPGSSPLSTVSNFRRGMSALGGRRRAPRGRWILMPRPFQDPDDSRRSAQRMRRNTFTVLVALAVATLGLGLLPSWRSLLWFHVAVDLVLAGYVALLVRLKEKLARDYVPRHSYVMDLPDETDELDLPLAEHF